MAKYRIVEHNRKCFEPQILRWWWPFWTSVASCSYTGHDWSPLSLPSQMEAEAYIDAYRHPSKYAPITHEVP